MISLQPPPPAGKKKNQNKKRERKKTAERERKREKGLIIRFPQKYSTEGRQEWLLIKAGVRVAIRQKDFQKNPMI